MDEVKHVFAVYAMEPTEVDDNGIKDAEPRLKQRFWVDEETILADFEDVMYNLSIEKPELRWMADNCIEKNNRPYINAEKAFELIMELVAAGKSKAGVNDAIWYGQYVVGRLRFRAKEAYEAEVVRQGLPFEPGEDELNLEGKDGDGD